MERIRIFQMDGVILGDGQNIWEGVIFDNDCVAGRYMSNGISRYDFYPSLIDLEKVMGSQRKLILESSYGQMIEIVTDPELTTDGNKTVAQGYICANGSVVVINIARYWSIYWYKNIDQLHSVIDGKTLIIPYKNFYPPDNLIWKRGKIYK